LGVCLLAGCNADCDDQNKARAVNCGTPTRPVQYTATRIKFDELKIATRKMLYNIGDLNGDGQWDFVIKDMPKYKDPGSGWFPSTATVTLTAFKHDGTYLWKHDLGTGIEPGIWYTPTVVFDCDGDGKAEIYTKGADPSSEYPNKITSGNEYIYKLDPATGAILKKSAWPPRIGDYNRHDARNQLAIAYLDGNKPAIVAIRGTYGRMDVWAFDSDLNSIWKSTFDGDGYGGSSHSVTAGDADGDGKDEILLGDSMIDDNGKGLWTLGPGHVDAAYFGEINWSHPGLEVFLGKEHGPNGGLYDAKTGQALWTHHFVIEGQGVLADLDPTSPGLEFAGKRQIVKDKQWAIEVYSAETGKGLGSDNKYGAGLRGGQPAALWWLGTEKQSVEGTDNVPDAPNYSCLTVDIMGDWREELLVQNGAEKTITIYSPTGPTAIHPRSPMTNRKYRTDVARGFMGSGYLHRPILSKRLTEL
jgi:hypothetical protein